MKRFRFSLDRVLRYRQLQVEAEEAKLQAQLARLRDVDARIAQLDQETARTEAAVRRQLTAGAEIRTAELAAYPDYRFLLARGQRSLGEERRRRLEEITRQRAVLLEAHKAREVLERARENARKEWLSAYAKEQEDTAAELFLTKWKRGPNG